MRGEGKEGGVRVRKGRWEKGSGRWEKGGERGGREDKEGKGEGEREVHVRRRWEG